MPLKKGAKARTRKGFSDNVKAEVDAIQAKKPGVSKKKAIKQAVAIAYSEADKKKTKPKKKSTKKKK